VKAGDILAHLATYHDARQILLHELACALVRVLGNGEISSGPPVFAPVVVRLVEDGLSFRALALEMRSRGFHRSSMWYRRRFASSVRHRSGGAGAGQLVYPARGVS